MKSQLANNPQDRELINKKFEVEDKSFLSNQKVAEGWKLWEQKDFEGAKNLFNDAINLNTNNSGAYFGRGLVYDDLKQYERAIQDLNKAIELNPNNTVAKNNREACLKAMGK